MHKKLYTPNLSILSDSLWQHFENQSRYIVQEHQAENLLTELSSEMKVGRSKIKRDENKKCLWTAYIRNFNKTAGIKAKPWMFRLPFKVYGAVITWKN